MDKRNDINGLGRRGQSAIEFLALVGFMLVVFIVLMGLITSKTIEIGKEKDKLTGEDIVTKVQKEVQLATRVADGYLRSFTLPDNAGAKPYTILLTQNEVTVTIGNNDYWRALPDVQGTINAGSNTIQKRDGVVYLNS
jgi:hypothetical protein